MILVPDEKRQISYTAGLSDGGWCELAMSGIPGQALMILNEVVGVLRASDRRPADGMIVEKAVSVPLKLRKVRDTSIGPVARSREEKAGRKRPNFIQVLWPDADGYYPDQMEYDDINLPQELL